MRGDIKQLIGVLAILALLGVSLCGCGGVEEGERAAYEEPAADYADMACAEEGAAYGGEEAEAPSGVSAPPSPEACTMPAAQPTPDIQFNTEEYDTVSQNDFLLTADEPLSTFSIDVDTASYSNVRRFLNSHQLPPGGAVRIEEMVNYFDYAYEPPKNSWPFAAHVEVAACPWAPDHQLAKIGIKGKVVVQEERPPANLVFLIDASGSMRDTNKLPLVKQGLKMLVRQLGEEDFVSIVVYAGSSGVVLPPTSCINTRRINSAIDGIGAGGSTAGAAGIRDAYEAAQRNFVRGGINRIILCTDGDFNIGITDQSRLVDLITEKAKSGVFLSVFGFGMGNYKDARLEALADNGNGNYGYIDTLSEARKVFVEQMSGTLMTIAKDVKIQVDFNPAHVQAYRLIGYENRLLQNRDFNDDTKDAGEIGAGHTVTAFYEIVPPGADVPMPKVETSKYQTPSELSDEAARGEILTVKIRYKEPDGDTSKLLTYPILADIAGRPSGDFQFASAVALFGQLLRDGSYTNEADYDTVLELAEAGQGPDRNGYRSEFVSLVLAAQSMDR